MRKIVIMLLLTMAALPTSGLPSQLTKLPAKSESSAETLGRQLMKATSKNDAATARRLLQLGANVNYRHHKNGVSPLALAAARGNLKLVKFYISKGAYLDATDNKGTTAFHAAIVRAQTRVFNYLLSKGAKATRGHAGLTPLMLASWAGADEIVASLVRNDADVNEKQPDGWTPLMHAAYNGHLSTVKLLVRFGAKTKMKAKDNKTAEQVAAERGHKNVENFLKSN